MGGDKEHAGVGNRVRAARVRSGMTREQLAVRSGLSWSAIAQIETGRRTNLRPATLVACARALGVTVDYLLGCIAPGALLDHHALIYEGGDEFVATAAPFLRTGIENDEPTLAVTTGRNIGLLREALGADVRHVTIADSADWYSEPLAALNAYSRFASEACAGGSSWTRVLGEPLWSGRSDDDIKCWTRYESLLNLAFAGLPLTVVCPYDAQTLDGDVVDHAHATHAETLGPHGVEPNPRYIDPGDFLLRP
jgi:transcriptional regulator with XRE-family HTH domain